MLKHPVQLGFALLPALVGSNFGSNLVSSPQVSDARGTYRAPAGSEAPAVVSPGGIHTVQSGETPWGIAHRSRVDYDQLVELNGLSATKPVIRVGRTLKLPPRRATENTAAEKRTPGNTATEKGPSGYDYHVVRRGETLYGIARRHRLTIPTLKTVNQIANPKTLQVGQTLRIPRHGKSPPQAEPTAGASPKLQVGEQAPPPPPHAEVQVARVRPPSDRAGKAPNGYALYKTQPGDTAASIAEHYGISKTELLRLNRQSSKPDFEPRPGQLLMVPTDGSWYIPTKQRSSVAAADPKTPANNGQRRLPPDATSKVVKHIVAPNDTLQALAKHYHTTVDQIRLDNRGIRSNRDLRVGSDLKIQPIVRPHRPPQAM